MAERQEVRNVQRRRAPSAAPLPVGRLKAANDNTPPMRQLLAKLALAATCFAATFLFAWWWLA